MFRFFYYTAIFVIIGGLMLHYNADIKGVSEWLGQLPGDMYVKKGNSLFFFPLTSACLVSAIVNIFYYTFFKKK
ncbi:MAG TPA: DUF2905 domain-containing protein [Chlamydiales bacterium]|nr:DUF2905 domain-containing protein [Chlamydiales bacterium]